MRVFGIDPGSERTGYGCVETDGSRHRIVMCGAVGAPLSAPFSEKLFEIHRRLVELLAGKGVCITSTAPQWLEVTGSTAEAIGEIAAGSQIVLHELTPVKGSLEDAYMALTQEAVEYHSGEAGLTDPAPDPAGADLAFSSMKGANR